MATQSALSTEIDPIFGSLVAKIEQIKSDIKAKVPEDVDLSEEIDKLDDIEVSIAVIFDREAHTPASVGKESR